MVGEDQGVLEDSAGRLPKASQRNRGQGDLRVMPRLKFDLNTHNKRAGRELPPGHKKPNIKARKKITAPKSYSDQGWGTGERHSTRGLDHNKIQGPCRSPYCHQGKEKTASSAKPPDVQYKGKTTGLSARTDHKNSKQRDIRRWQRQKRTRLGGNC